MANKKPRDISKIQSRNIHYNGKNFIYADAFTKNVGYVLSNNEAERIAFFETRYFLSISMGVVAFFVFKNILIGLAVGIGMVILTELSFRLKFLKELPVIENYQKPKPKPLLDIMEANYSIKRLVILILFGLGITILVPINAKMSNYEGMNLYLNYVISAGMGIFVILVVITLLRKLKKNK